MVVCFGGCVYSDLQFFGRLWWTGRFAEWRDQRLTALAVTIFFSPVSNDDPGRKSSIFVRWFLFQKVKFCNKKILVLLGLVQMVVHSWYRYHNFWSPKMPGRVFDFVGKPFPKSQNSLWKCFPTKSNKRIWLLNLPHGQFTAPWYRKDFPHGRLEAAG